MAPSFTERDNPMQDAPRYGEDRYFWARTPIFRARRALRIGYTSLPLVAGVDKFMHLLVDWGRYVAPAFVRGAAIPVNQILYVVGVFEIALAAVVAVAPRVGAYLVGVWLCAIALNLVALSDSWGLIFVALCLAAGAYALARVDSASRFM